MRLRLASLNLWDAPWHADDRRVLATRAVLDLGPDILGIQEIGDHTRGVVDDLAEAGYLIWPTPGTDLAVASRHPIEPRDLDPPRPDTLGSCLIRVDGYAIGVTNLHGASESVLDNELTLVAAATQLDATGMHEVMLGDFNNIPGSAGYWFLRAQQSLHGAAVQAWHDLLARWATEQGTQPEPTLDFFHNPRWRDHPTLEEPLRVDRIHWHDGFLAGLPWPRLLDAGRFGVTPEPGTGLWPSDHAGVYADLDIDTTNTWQGPR